MIQKRFRGNKARKKVKQMRLKNITDIEKMKIKKQEERKKKLEKKIVLN